MQCITFDRYIEASRVLENYSVEYPFMRDHLLGVIEECFPGDLSMLDIGAGTGKFARSFLERCRVPVRGDTAIEPSKNHVAQIRENLDGIPVEKEIICDHFTPATVVLEIVRPRPALPLHLLLPARPRTVPPACP